MSITTPCITFWWNIQSTQLTNDLHHTVSRVSHPWQQETSCHTHNGEDSFVSPVTSCAPTERPTGASSITCGAKVVIYRFKN